MFPSVQSRTPLRDTLRPPRCRGLFRHAQIATSALLPAIALPAFAIAQTSPDAITGTWTGRIGATADPNFAIKLELRLDGTSISGTVSTGDGNGRVLDGRYDSVTGTLHIGIARANEDTVSLEIDGVAVQGLATGRVKRGQTTGTFVLERGAANAEHDSSAVSLDRTQLRTAFDELTRNITKAAELVPADRFGWRPVGTVRTLGQIVGHIADAHLYYCGRAAGQQVQWSDAIADGPSDKRVLIAKLGEAAGRCSAAFASGNMGPLVANFGHANLHYGNLVTYLRLLGITPPTSG